MVHVTFFEIHLDDATFEANAPFTSKGEESAADEAAEATEAEGLSAGGDEGPPKAAQLVVGVVLLVVLAAAVRKLRNRGGDDEPATDVAEELDVEAA